MSKNINKLKIYKGLRQKLEEMFPSITVAIKDIQNVAEPCIYVKFNSETVTAVNANYERRTEEFGIFYFSDQTTETLLDLMNFSEKISELATDVIQVDERTFLPVEGLTTEYDEEDDICITTITFTFEQSTKPKASSNTNKMNVLDLKSHLKE